ncbi:MAG: carboxylesterase family protein, partial [Ruthenibacterium sp.]
MAMKFDFDRAPVVQTKYGKLRGYCCDNTYTFKGIPYAEAKRFQAPDAPAAWDGEREATSYGFVCPLLTQDTPNGEMLVPHRYWPQNENCQNLNLWTQGIDDKKRPVLVWLHGGGFTAGSSIEQKAYNGANMSHFGNAVVVSINHRLNVLGYLDLSPFGEKYANSANAGQADIVVALQWVRDNIAAFGGDPDNVTIFGQSGGGMKVSALMQTPCADGLFHKAIIMSGVVGDLMPAAQGDGTAIVNALLKELGFAENEVEKLETVPYPLLAAAYNKVSMPIAQAGGYIGGMPLANDFYLGEGPAVGFTEHAKTIPVMAGTVFGEFSFAPSPFNKQTISVAAADAILTQKFGAHTEALKAEFAKAYPDKNPIDLLALDVIFRTPTKQFIAAKAQHQDAPTYSYLFSFDFPYQYGKPAWHCSDIPFVFHNTCEVPIANVPGVTDKLEEQIFACVMSFARTGSPEHDEIPAWPPCKAGEEATMRFDRTCT